MPSPSELDAYNTRLSSALRRTEELHTDNASLKAQIAAKDADIGVLEADIAAAQNRREMARMRVKSIVRKLDKSL